MVAAPTTDDGDIVPPLIEEPGMLGDDSTAAGEVCNRSYEGNTHSVPLMPTRTVFRNQVATIALTVNKTAFCAPNARTTHKIRCPMINTYQHLPFVDQSPTAITAMQSAA